MPNNKNILREKINELNIISNHFQEMTEILKDRDKTDWNTIKHKWWHLGRKYKTTYLNNNLIKYKVCMVCGEKTRGEVMITSEFLIK